MKKYENFKSALVNLKDIYSYQEPFGNVEITGMVGLFEICFEQAWKAMKEVLENYGLRKFDKHVIIIIFRLVDNIYSYGFIIRMCDIIP